MSTTTTANRAEKRKKRLSFTAGAGLTIKHLASATSETTLPNNSLNSSIAIEGTKHLMNLIELLSSEVDLLRSSLAKEKEEKELLKEWVEDLFSSHLSFYHSDNNNNNANNKSNDRNINNENNDNNNTDLNNNNNNNKNENNPNNNRENKKQKNNFNEWLIQRNEREEQKKLNKSLKRSPTSSPTSPLQSRGMTISNSVSLTTSSTYSSLTSSSPSIIRYSHLAIPPPPPSSSSSLSSSSLSNSPDNKIPVRSSSKINLSLISQCPLPPPITDLLNDEILSSSSLPFLPSSHVEGGKGLKLIEGGEGGGCTVEDGFSDLSQNCVDSYDLIESDLEIPYYAKFFYNKPHSIYMHEDNEKNEVLFVTVATPTADQKEDAKIAVIVTSFAGNKLIILKGSKNIKKRALQAVDLNPSLIQLKEVKDLSIRNQLLSMEAREIQIRKKYKFGILFAKENQSENDMFNNKDGSEDFEQFLEILGERISLNGWTKYTGGLDVKTDTTGYNSIYTNHRGVEIMFHVSTLLPYVGNDDQQLERKRHLGNDVVLIIFKEGNTPFSPKIIRSHFNCIFLVVQKVPSLDSITSYQISMGWKEGINQFPPLLPDPPIFKRDEVFRDFLLTKCINGERSAMHSPEFAPRLSRARVGSMQLIAKEFSNKK